MNVHDRKVGRGRVWAGFGVLCLLAGSRWLVETAVPSLLPAGPRAAIHAGLLALVFGLIVLMKGQLRSSGLGLGGVAGWGVLVFALPGAVVAGAAGRVAGLTEELAFLLLPTATVFVVAQRSGFGEGEDVRRLLAPALAGLGGAMLLVPFALPVSVAGRLWLGGLVVAVLLAGWATVKLHDELRSADVLSASAAISLASMLVTAFAQGWVWVGGLTAGEWLAEGATALLLDGPVLVLGVWCLREMPPIRFSARTLAVLLIAILESIVAARPHLTWTMIAGALLMAVGCAWLLREG